MGTSQRCMQGFHWFWSVRHHLDGSKGAWRNISEHFKQERWVTNDSSMQWHRSETRAWLLKKRCFLRRRDPAKNAVSMRVATEAGHDGVVSELGLQVLFKP